MLCPDKFMNLLFYFPVKAVNTLYDFSSITVQHHHSCLPVIFLMLHQEKLSAINNHSICRHPVAAVSFDHIIPCIERNHSPGCLQPDKSSDPPGIFLIHIKTGQFPTLIDNQNIADLSYIFYSTPNSTYCLIGFHSFHMDHPVQFDPNLQFLNLNFLV